MNINVLIVDDDSVNAEALKIVVDRRIINATTTLCRFYEAATVDVREFDYVLIDLAHPDVINPLADEYPGVRAATSVLVRRGSSPRPFVVVTTGESASFGRTLVRRRLLEARCEFFVHRSELDQHIEAIITATGPHLEKMSTVSESLHRKTVYQHGPAEVGPDARINKFVSVFPTMGIATRRLKGQKLTDDLANVSDVVNVRYENLRVRGVGPAWYRRLFQHAGRIVPDETIG